MAVILAVDGGNSKTDVAVLTEDGTVLGTARGPGFTPHRVGVAAAVEVIAATAARWGMGFDHVAAYLAGADLPADEAALRGELLRRGLGRSVVVGNDTLAVLRSGTSAGWGVAVVCGAGINAVGVAPDGRVARFPALGRVTGDWGGGAHLAEEVLWHAARAEDGRGPVTSLAPLVRRTFRVPRVLDVAVAAHRGEADLGVLVAPLFAHAAFDAVAGAVVERLADEVCALGRVVLTRLGLLGVPTEVVLGGGVLTAGHSVLLDAIRARYAAVAPLAVLVVPTRSPLAGAAHLALDGLGAPTSAHARVDAALAVDGDRGGGGEEDDPRGPGCDTIGW